MMEIRNRLTRWRSLEHGCLAFGDEPWRRRLLWGGNRGDQIQYFPGPPLTWYEARARCADWIRSSLASGRLEMIGAGESPFSADVALMPDWADQISLSVEVWQLERNGVPVPGVRVRLVDTLSVKLAMLAFASDDLFDAAATRGWDLPSNQTLTRCLRNELFEKLADGLLIGEGYPVMQEPKVGGSSFPPPSIEYPMAYTGHWPHAFGDRRYSGGMMKTVGEAVEPLQRLPANWWTVDRYDMALDVLQVGGRWFSGLTVREPNDDERGEAKTVISGTTSVAEDLTPRGSIGGAAGRLLSGPSPTATTNGAKAEPRPRRRAAPKHYDSRYSKTDAAAMPKIAALIDADMPLAEAIRTVAATMAGASGNSTERRLRRKFGDYSANLDALAERNDQIVQKNPN